LWARGGGGGGGELDVEEEEEGPGARPAIRGDVGQGSCGLRRGNTIFSHQALGHIVLLFRVITPQWRWIPAKTPNVARPHHRRRNPGGYLSRWHCWVPSSGSCSPWPCPASGIYNRNSFCTQELQRAVLAPWQRGEQAGAVPCACVCAFPRSRGSKEGGRRARTPGS
jgi:hypothetical protein